MNENKIKFKRKWFKQPPMLIEVTIETKIIQTKTLTIINKRKLHEME